MTNQTSLRELILLQNDMVYSGYENIVKDRCKELTDNLEEIFMHSSPGHGRTNVLLSFMVDLYEVTVNHLLAIEHIKNRRSTILERLKIEEHPPVFRTVVDQMEPTINKLSEWKNVLLKQEQYLEAAIAEMEAPVMKLLVQLREVGIQPNVKFKE